jgi:hypothetical protein
MRNQLIYLILVLAISGCISPRKLAKKCAEEYPCEIDTIELVRMERDSFIIPWHTVEFIDTTECPPADTASIVIKEVVKEIPPRVIVRDKLDTVLQLVYADSARVASLRFENARLQQQTINLKNDLARQSGKRTWFWAFLATLAALVVVLVVQFFMR